MSSAKAPSVKNMGTPGRSARRCIIAPLDTLPAYCDNRHVMKKTTITSSLREAIKSSGIPPFRLAQQAGIDHAVVYRFLDLGSDIRLSSADKILSALNMSVKLNESGPVDGRGAENLKNGR